MLHYILQVVFFQLGFLLVYELLLKKETFFNYNRWYLLLTPVLALVLPLLRFEGLSEVVPAESLVLLPEVFIDGNKSAQEVAAAENGFQLNGWLLGYLLGVFASFIMFFRKYSAVKKLFRYRVVSEENDAKIIEVPNSKLACTFYRTIFLGDQLSEPEKQQILSHERVHVNQKHSLDLVFFELLKIIFWFNPLVYIYQTKIASLHEFMADAQAIKSTERKQYYQQLLNTAFNTENISFINQFFNHSIIKKRIVMLQKSKSKTVAKFKYLLLVPLMLVMLTYVACSEESPVPAPVNKEAIKAQKLNKIKSLWANDELSSEEKGEKITEILSSMKAMGIMPPPPPPPAPPVYDAGEVPFSVIENVPVFPGCEELTSNKARKACFSDQIREFVDKNFDTGLGKKLKLDGINRIYVQFVITPSGNVEVKGARGPHPELEKEAKRVVSALPQMKPGKQNGEAVGTIYSLPIIFKVGE